MIRVFLYYRYDRLEGLVVEGHAGYGPRGQDIVCAAVSALAQTAVLALERLAGVEPQADIREGRLGCFLPANLSREARERAGLILETAALGLAEVARAHPRYVRVLRREEPRPGAGGPLNRGDGPEQGKA